MHGPDMAILLMYESWVMRHSACGIETLNSFMHSGG